MSVATDSQITATAIIGIRGHGLVTENSAQADIGQHQPDATWSIVASDLHVSTRADTKQHRTTPPDSGSIPVHLGQTPSCYAATDVAWVTEEPDYPDSGFSSVIAVITSCATQRFDRPGTLAIGRRIPTFSS